MTLKHNEYAAQLARSFNLLCQ